MGMGHEHGGALDIFIFLLIVLAATTIACAPSTVRKIEESSSIFLKVVKKELCFKSAYLNKRCASSAEGEAGKKHTLLDRHLNSTKLRLG